MIRYLIKNNFKLMFRNTWSIVLLIVGPILVIAAVSSAFTELMKSYEGVDEFTVGYQLEQDSFAEPYMEMIFDAGKENGITFQECRGVQAEEALNENQMSGFVTFGRDSYVVYESSEHKAEGQMLEAFLGKVMDESKKTVLRMTGAYEEKEIVLPVEELSFMPSVDAKNYYGIAEIVYFSWCIIICATGVLSNEKRYGIGKKFQISNLSETQLYLSRLLPVVLTGMLGIGLDMILTVFLFDIQWGNLPLTLLVVFCMVLAGSSFGLMLYSVTRNLAVTIIALFMVVWMMGFFGGSFETYMFSSTADGLKQTSPIYYGNRSLVELSCMGESSYVEGAIGYALAITAGSSIISVLAAKLRKGGKA